MLIERTFALASLPDGVTVTRDPQPPIREIVDATPWLHPEAKPLRCLDDARMMMARDLGVELTEVLIDQASFDAFRCSPESARAAEIYGVRLVPVPALPPLSGGEATDLISRHARVQRVVVIEHDLSSIRVTADRILDFRLRIATGAGYCWLIARRDL